jgi:serine O-acetyltransferase
MLPIIKADLFRYKPGDYSIKKLLSGMGAQGFRYLFFRRLRDHFGSKSIIGIISQVFLKRYTYKFGFQIGGSIGPGFYIGHFGTIVVSIHAKIGCNCNIAHNVTIGAARGKRMGAPIIGNEVWIGTGAVLVGNITIGDNVMIAPNSFVNMDVPGNSVVIGNPAKIIPKEYPTRDYINNKYPNGTCIKL